MGIILCFIIYGLHACLLVHIYNLFKPKYCRKWVAILEQGIWQHEVYIVVKILLASCGVVVKRHSTVTTRRSDRL